MASEHNPKLVAVKVEDQSLVMDLLRVVQALSLCADYTINVAPKGYEVLAWLKTEEDVVDMSLEEVDLLNDVNPARIRAMGVRFLKGGKAAVRIRVISLSEPCMINDTILLRVRKRARWWGDAI